MHTVRMVVLGVAIVGVACSNEARDSQTLESSTSAGVTTVYNGPVGRLGMFDLQETLRLGAVDGDGPQVFSEVFALARDEYGRVLVGNNGSGTVRVFDGSGGFVTEVGGRGRGPGEVTSINRVFAVGDTIGIVDWQGGGKVILYDVAGDLLASWTTRRPDGTRIQPTYRTSEGWLASVTRPGGLPHPSPGEVDTVFQRVHVTQFGSSDVGPVRYTVPLYRVFGVDVQGEGGVDWPLFWPRFVHGYSSDGRLFVTDDQEYRIDIYTRAGLVRTVRREYEPRELAQPDIAAFRRAALHVLDTMSGLADSQRAGQRTSLTDRLDRQATIPLPTVMTPLSEILVSRDGSFWVQVASEQDLIADEASKLFTGFGAVPSHETTWDLYDTEGGLLGSVVLPARFRAEAVDEMRVTGVSRDAYDVEFVVSYTAVSGN